MGVRRGSEKWGCLGREGGTRSVMAGIINADLKSSDCYSRGTEGIAGFTRPLHRSQCSSSPDPSNLIDTHVDTTLHTFCTDCMSSTHPLYIANTPNENTPRTPPAECTPSAIYGGLYF